MNIIRMKLVPRADAGTTEVSFYSCPDVKGDPEKTRQFIQRTADSRNVAFEYIIVSDLEYHAVRGAREWLLSEPGDSHADYCFRNILVRAKFAPAPERITGINCTGEDDTTVIVSTEMEQMTIDTKTGDVKVEPTLRARPHS